MPEPTATDTSPTERATRFWLEQGGGDLPTSGRSMSPTFEESAKVWIERGRRARFGDVLVFRSGTLLVVHRVVTLLPGRSVRTKGDGIPHLDLERATPEHVLGRVVEIQRGDDRFRTDRFGGRLYAWTVAAVSALQGLAYRIAWRLDRLVSSPGRERMPMRAFVASAGRAVLRELDRALFRAMNTRVAPTGVGTGSGRGAVV